MQTLKIGIAGLGSVGAGLVGLVQQQADLRLSGALEIHGVSARSRDKKRPVDTSSYTWFDDPVALAKSDDIDIFVELIGGADGPAKAAVEAALSAGKPVVTGNKALIAMHGSALSALAKQNGVDLLFEAAVAGGIPIVRTLRDSLSGTKITRILGILNGTCNYLTTEMAKTSRDYAEVLEDAKALGYAETDPYLDVSGTDAAHKIAILSAIAFSGELDFDKVSISGVDTISLTDLTLANQLGLTIKLIATAEAIGDMVVNRVEPVGLSAGHALAQVHGTLNAVIVDSEGLGEVTLIGHGAGAGPTASAVMGDVAKLFQSGFRDSFGRAAHHIARKFTLPTDNDEIGALILVNMSDERGALAQVTEALAQNQISVIRLVQNSANTSNIAPIGIITHKANRTAITQAIASINSLNVVRGAGKYLPIL